MGVITDVDSFDDVYELDFVDDVLGGPGGPSNKPGQTLANRTRWLKNKLDELGLRVDALRTFGEIQILGAVGYVNTDYDGTGLGAGDAEGWALCNGQNGTDNLLDRFLVGMNPNDIDNATPGNTGGAKSVVLQETEMPRHRHGVNAVRNNGSVTFDGGSSGAQAVNNANGGANYTDYAGSNQAHENRPPYYVVVFRQWIVQ